MDGRVEPPEASPMRWVWRGVGALLVAVPAGSLGGPLAQAAGAVGDERSGTWTALAAAGGLSVLAALVVAFAGPRRRPAPAQRAADEWHTPTYVRPTPPQRNDLAGSADFGVSTAVRDLRAPDDGPLPQNDLTPPEGPGTWPAAEDTATLQALAEEVHARRAAVTRQDR